VALLSADGHTIVFSFAESDGDAVSPVTSVTGSSKDDNERSKQLSKASVWELLQLRPPQPTVEQQEADGKRSGDAVEGPSAWVGAMVGGGEV